MSGLIRNLHALWRAESLIVSVKLQLASKRGVLFGFAGMVGIFGIGMLNVAGFFALQPVLGAVLAAVLMAVTDFLISLLVVFWAQATKISPDLDLAKEVRQAAIDELEAELAAFQAEISTLRDEFASIKEAAKSFARQPFDFAIQSMILPLVKSIIKSRRSSKKKTGE
jgi:cell division protein FtsB